MSRTDFETLLKAGCHFGHLKRKWNPAMAPYIFMERNGIHIIDLNKTVAMVDTAAEALKQIAKSGKRILFVATKKQAKDIVAEKAKALDMPYVIERWPGGMFLHCIHYPGERCGSYCFKWYPTHPGCPDPRNRKHRQSVCCGDDMAVCL